MDSSLPLSVRESKGNPSTGIILTLVYYCEFSAVYLKRSDCNGRGKLEWLVWKNNSCLPVTLEWFSIQIFVNFDFLNCHLSFLYAFKVLNCLLCIKRRFEPHNTLRNILRQFENFQINKGLYGKLLKRDWVVRVVFPYKSF